jgi:hypothetical protein
MGTSSDATSRGTDGGFSLANVAELLFPCLDAVGARSVMEIGAFRGDLTRELLDWANAAGARVTAIEPLPPLELLELANDRPELELVRKTGQDALGDGPLPDALIIDGDHNYYTLSEELRAIDERARDSEMPLLMFHDVGWPHARRDTYYAPERVPDEHRQPLARDAAIVPGESGTTEMGLRYEWAAEREGGPRNGVLTAIEDFVRDRPDLRLAIVPAFFGFGVLWRNDAPWGDAVAAILAPWDRSPLVERLEANRVAHMIDSVRKAHELEQLALMRERRDRYLEQERLLRTMLGSRAFTWGERLSRLRKGGRPTFSRDQVRRALDDGPA